MIYSIHKKSHYFICTEYINLSVTRFAVIILKFGSCRFIEYFWEYENYIHGLLKYHSYQAELLDNNKHWAFSIRFREHGTATPELLIILHIYKIIKSKLLWSIK